MTSAAPNKWSFDFASLVLKGREVVLRPLVPSDADALAAAAAENRDQFGFTPVPNGIDEARAYIDKAIRMRETDERYAFAVLWQGRVVGSTSYYDLESFAWPAAHAELARVTTPDGLEIGHTWLGASAQRTRCNSEAKYLLLQYAFETWRVHRVRLRTDERNQRSRNAIARIGAKFDGILRGDKAGSDGTLRNSAFFSILLSEWPEVAEQLRRKLDL